jgi:hypothetical protein
MVETSSTITYRKSISWFNRLIEPSMTKTVDDGCCSDLSDHSLLWWICQFLGSPLYSWGLSIFTTSNPLIISPTHVRCHVVNWSPGTMHSSVFTLDIVENFKLDGAFWVVVSNMWWHPVSLKVYKSKAVKVVPNVWRFKSGPWVWWLIHLKMLKKGTVASFSN